VEITECGHDILLSTADCSSFVLNTRIWEDLLC
jgi:hypothetical protein